MIKIIGKLQTLMKVLNYIILILTEGYFRMLLILSIVPIGILNSTQSFC